MSERFKVRIEDLQPSQLYISEDKLRAIRNKETLKNVPVPVIDLDGILVMADGRSRSITAIIEGQDSMLVEITDENLDLKHRRMCEVVLEQGCSRRMTLLAG
ncbi:hypothetical protein [Mesotoga sp.]|uniref:hypothetical protein n=1 Tax=Mesotoga sp. TaxID=2053577 RepID=UPI00345EA3EA